MLARSRAVLLSLSRLLSLTPLLRGTLVTLAVGSLGCGDTSVRPGALVDQQALFWTLGLNHRAILLSTRAPYDTLRLVATPRNSHGDVLAGLPAPAFSSSDRTRVIVSPDGLLQARAPMPPQQVVMVIATLTASNLRHADTAYVRVTDVDPLPMVGSLSIHPLPPDSAKVAASGGFIQHDLSLRVTDVDGVPIPTMPGDTEGAAVLPVDLRAADISIAHIYNNSPDVGGSSSGRPPTVVGNQPGTTAVYATTTAFGVTKADTLLYRIGLPLKATITLVSPEGNVSDGDGILRSSNIFTWGNDLQIGVGGILDWRVPAIDPDSNMVVDVVFHEADLPNIFSATPYPNYLNQPILEFGGYTGPISFFLECTPLGLLFRKSDCVNSGNFVIGPIAGGVGYDNALRKFVAPGTYEFSSTRYPGSHGRIIVVDER